MPRGDRAPAHKSGRRRSGCTRPAAAEPAPRTTGLFAAPAASARPRPPPPPRPAAPLAFSQLPLLRVPPPAAVAMTRRRAGRRQEFVAGPAAPSVAPAPLAAPPMSPLSPSCRPGAGHDTRATAAEMHRAPFPRGCGFPPPPLSRRRARTSHRAVPRGEMAHDLMATSGPVCPRELQARALGTAAHRCHRPEPAAPRPPRRAAAWRGSDCPGAAVPFHATLCPAALGHGKDPRGSANPRKPRATQQFSGGWSGGTGSPQDSGGSCPEKRAGFWCGSFL